MRSALRSSGPKDAPGGAAAPVLVRALGAALGAGVLPALGLLLAAGAPRAARAQELDLRGYYLNVASYQGSSPYGPDGALDLQRLRLMLDPRLGPATLDVAYEHTLRWSQRPFASTALLPGGVAEAPVDWLKLDWTLGSGAHAVWRHRLDRLSVALPLGPAAELTVGRQAISWATTLLFTPTDPFAPFDPSDPFREYRAGVDAARLQYFAGPFTALDLVVRPEGAAAGHRVTVLLRGSTRLSAWDLSGWAGTLHDEPAVAVGADRSLGGWAVRADATVRRKVGGGTVVRAAAGADRLFSLAGRDLHLVGEYQHDGFGSADASGYARVLSSPAYRRGELQTLGRDEVLADASWQVHPLVSGEILVIVNLHDASTLVAPALDASLSNDVSARLGLYLSGGRGGAEPNGTPRSEYGPVPTYLYLSLTAFF